MGLAPERWRFWVSVYLKGAFMGAADTIPGVSGGTIALITGIYERLVTAIASLDPRLLGHLLRAHDGDERERFVRAVATIDVGFLLVLGLGILSAVLALSRVLEVALETHRALMNAFFFGLIAASAVVLYREVDVDTPGRIAGAVAAFLFAFWLTGATAAGVFAHDPVTVFLSGAVTSSAMLLPGISGAALLYVLGQYEFMLDTLRRFVDAVLAAASGGPPAAAVEPGTTVLVFVAGVGLGLLSIAHAIRWALAHHRALTLTALVSLMVGALRLPAEEILANTARWNASTAGGVLVVGVVGAIVVLALDRYTADLEYSTPGQR